MNDIHPTAIIGEAVQLGRDNVIGPFAVITGSTRIGDSNWIGAGVIIGAPPEVRSFDHRALDDADEPRLVIGSNNVVREHAQIHRGWKGVTKLGDGAFIMNQVYVAHDGALGDGVTLASSVLLAGHVTVGDGANVGLGASVHQFRSIGAGAMVGMGSVVTRDIPPFAMAYGSPARVHGANRVGLQRAGASNAAVAHIDHALTQHPIEFDPTALDLPPAVRRAFAGTEG